MAFATVKLVPNWLEEERIATQRPPASTAPFVTRRSTITLSAISLLGAAAFQSLVSGDSAGAGSSGLIAAVSLAVAVVCGLVAWFCGVTLAVRARSTLWLVVAALPVFPINSMVCAMFCPATPATTRRR